MTDTMDKVEAVNDVAARLWSAQQARAARLRAAAMESNQRGWGRTTVAEAERWAKLIEDA